MKIQTLFILLLASLVCRVKAADKSLADPWLDRAAAELPEVRKELEQQKGKSSSLDVWLSEERIATVLFNCRPDQIGRDRLLELARRAEKALTGQDQSSIRFSPLDVASLYADAGERAEALRLLLSQEKAVAKPGLLESAFMPLIVASIREKIGELDDERLAKIPLFDLRILMEIAADENRPADVQRYLRQARKVVEAPAVKDALELTFLSESAAKSGQVTAAIELAREIPRDDYHRPESFAKIALAQHHAGDATGCLQNLNEALQAGADMKEGYRLGSYVFILHAAIEINEKAIISRSADGIWAAINAGEGGNYRADYLAQIATAYTLIGRQTDFARAIAASQAAVSKVPPEERPAFQIKVATAYARAGDKSSAEAAIVKAHAIGKLRDIDRGEYESLADAYADAGDFTAALSILNTNVPKPEDQTRCLQRIAWRQIQSSHYADAERTAALIQDPFRQFIVHRWIVTAKTRAANFEGLQTWIASHPTARQRAALYLAVAQQLLGKEGKRDTRVFVPPP